MTCHFLPCHSLGYMCMVMTRSQKEKMVAEGSVMPESSLIFYHDLKKEEQLVD